jgi:acyl-coenzyme A synthetase/AMP-(fatty) acid ligase
VAARANLTVFQPGAAAIGFPSNNRTMITNRIYEWAHSQPTKLALIHSDVTISYATFARAIDASHRFFANQDLPAGHTAIVLVHNLADAWIIIMALRALGLNTISVESIAQAEALKLKNVACLVVTETERRFHTSHGSSPVGTKVITLPRAIFANIHTGDLPRHPVSAFPFGGHILFTSGTTGTYKKVMQKGAIEEKRNAVRANQLLFDRNTVAHLQAMPLWTGGGFKWPSAAWYAGGCVVLDQTQHLYSNFFKHNITHALLIPSTLKSLLEKHAGPRENQINQIEFAVIGGFTPLKLAEQVVGELNSKLSCHYSSTESGSIIMYTHFRTKDDLYWFTPVSDRTIQIVDEFGNECPTGQEGRLGVLPTEIDCSSYLDDEEASAKVFRDGYFYPGDMAVRRADGRIRILGRADDVVNIQGRKAATAPIEQEIQDLLRVDEVCLFSGLNDQGIEELMIAIQSDRELPQSELDAVAGRFASFERVRFAILKEFPRTELGMRKVQRSVLRKLVFDKTGVYA